MINDGGMVGMLVTVEAPGDAKTLTGTSSRPKDVDVRIEPEISGLPDRRFFVINDRFSLDWSFWFLPFLYDGLRWRWLSLNRIF